MSASLQRIVMKMCHSNLMEWPIIIVTFVEKFYFTTKLVSRTEWTLLLSWYNLCTNLPIFNLCLSSTSLAFPLFVGKYFMPHPPFPSSKQWFYLWYTTFSFSCFWDPRSLSMWDIINHVWWHSPSENLCSATQITLTTASIYTKLRTKRGTPMSTKSCTPLP